MAKHIDFNYQQYKRELVKQILKDIWARREENGKAHKL